MIEQLVIEQRFSGPVGTANGGYAAGRLAAYVDGPATVRLSAPIPLATALDVTSSPDGTATFDLDGNTIASALPSAGPRPAAAPVVRAAAEATTPPPKWGDEHAFPTCFVCGPQRTPGDGLCIHLGPVDTDPDVWATVWSAPENLAGPDGASRPEFVWAMLDCPSAMACSGPGDVVVLGTITAMLHAPVPAAEPLTVVSRSSPPEGRKRFGHSAIYSADGVALAWADAVWITVNPS